MPDPAAAGTPIPGIVESPHLQSKHVKKRIRPPLNIKLKNRRNSQLVLLYTLKGQLAYALCAASTGWDHGAIRVMVLFDSCLKTNLKFDFYIHARTTDYDTRSTLLPGEGCTGTLILRSEKGWRMPQDAANWEPPLARHLEYKFLVLLVFLHHAIMDDYLFRSWAVWTHKIYLYKFGMSVLGPGKEPSAALIAAPYVPLCRLR